MFHLLQCMICIFVQRHIAVSFSPPKCWHVISNTHIYIQLIYIQKCIFSNTALKGRTEIPTIHAAPKCWRDISNTHIYIQLTFIPQIVGCIYPITNLYFFKCERHTRRSLFFGWVWGGGYPNLLNYQTSPTSLYPHVEDIMMKLKTICCKHNTFTLSMFDHGLNGHPNKIPTHISLK